MMHIPNVKKFSLGPLAGTGDGANDLKSLHARPSGAHQRVAGAARRQLVYGGECQEGCRGGL